MLKSSSSLLRDENIHMASTQQMLKLLPTDDKDYAKIAKECEADCVAMFMDAIEQEKSWADYLFADGSMIGLNCRTTQAICRLDCRQAYASSRTHSTLYYYCGKPIALDREVDTWW